MDFQLPTDMGRMNGRWLSDRYAATTIATMQGESFAAMLTIAFFAADGGSGRLMRHSRHLGREVRETEFFHRSRIPQAAIGTPKG